MGTLLCIGMMALLSLFVSSFFVPSIAFAEYTSLISASDFTAIQTDVTTAVAGIIAIALIILGAGLLMRTIGR